MENLLLGLQNVFMPLNFITIAGGTLLGLLVGAMPGLSATMAVALLIPVTYVMGPERGVSMLAAIYMGSMYGGSIAAVLICTPGTPAAAATTLDGYPMAQKGEAGHALGISLTASFVGGIISCIVLLTLAPVLGQIAIMFGPVELFGVAVLGMTILASLSLGSTIKGLLAGCAGLLLSTIGMDSITGIPRFTLGNINLFSGIPFTVALIGLFSIPQAIRLVEHDDDGTNKKFDKINDSVILPWAEIKELFPTFIRSGIIGVFTGIIPGTGGDTACWFAYNEEKRRHEDKSEFGKGSKFGIAAPEAANNAVVGGSLVPLLTLGVPGNAVSAIFLGALLIQGLKPGFELFSRSPEVVYGFIFSMFAANILFVPVGFLIARFSSKLLKTPAAILAPTIVVFAVIGSYAIRNNIQDINLMLFMGAVGCAMHYFKVPIAPVVLGLVLGAMAEGEMVRAYALANENIFELLKQFVTRPICLILLASCIYSVWHGFRQLNKKR